MRKTLLIIICLAGCRSTAVQTQPAPESTDYNSRWKALAPHIKKHFDTGDKTVEEIAADLSLAAYKLGIE